MHILFLYLNQCVMRILIVLEARSNSIIYTHICRRKFKSDSLYLNQFVKLLMPDNLYFHSIFLHPHRSLVFWKDYNLVKLSMFHWNRECSLYLHYCHSKYIHLNKTYIIASLNRKSF